MLAFMFIVSLLLTAFVVSAPAAAAAPSIDQCSSEHNVDGRAIECSYNVTNNVNGAVTSSTVVFTHCHGAANDPPTMVCNSSTTNSTDLVTSVNQCNYAGNGGGGTMECTVDVVNNITGTVTPTGATVNQCNNSADGDGTMSCNPFPAATSGATVTQCNDSANGGGSDVTCTMDTDSTTTSVLPVKINQCNNSENLGGSTVKCRSGLTDNITPPAPSPSPSPTVTPDAGVGDNDGGKPDKDQPDEDDGTPDEQTSGGTPGGGTTTDNPTGTDSGTPSGGITTSQVTKIPSGGANTGGGSTSGIENAGLLMLGVLLIAASTSALVIARRVRVRA